VNRRENWNKIYVMFILFLFFSFLFSILSGTRKVGDGHLGISELGFVPDGGFLAIYLAIYRHLPDVVASQG